MREREENGVSRRECLTLSLLTTSCRSTQCLTWLWLCY